MMSAMGDEHTTSAPWRTNLLSYVSRLDGRALVEINTVVIHATALPTLAMAREFAEVIHYPGSQTGNSGHFYIDQAGQIACWVSMDRVAHHTVGYNQTSLGIELVHPGRYPNWLDSDQQAWDVPYPEAQIDALVSLLRYLKNTLPQLHHIAGHDELDTTLVKASDDPTKTVRRKRDPGPTFPWPKVLEASQLMPLLPKH